MGGTNFRAGRRRGAAGAARAAQTARGWSAGPGCAPCSKKSSYITRLLILQAEDTSPVQVRQHRCAPALPRVQEHELARRECRVLAQPSTRCLRTVAGAPRTLSAPCQFVGCFCLVACRPPVPRARRPRRVAAHRARYTCVLRQPQLLLMRRLCRIAGQACCPSGRRMCGYRRGRPVAGGVARAEPGQARQLRRQRRDVSLQLAGRQRAGALLIKTAQVQALCRTPY